MNFKGIALEPHTEVVGETQTEKIYPEKALRDAAKTLKGRPIHYSSSPNARRIIGKVMDAKYVEGEGVVYEAVIEVEEMADHVRKGRSEVAPILTHEYVSLDDEPHVINDLVFEGLFLTPVAADGVPGVTEVED